MMAFALALTGLAAFNSLFVPLRLEHQILAAPLTRPMQAAGDSAAWRSLHAALRPNAHDAHAVPDHLPPSLLLLASVEGRNATGAGVGAGATAAGHPLANVSAVGLAHPALQAASGGSMAATAAAAAGLAAPQRLDPALSPVLARTSQYFGARAWGGERPRREPMQEGAGQEEGTGGREGAEGGQQPGEGESEGSRCPDVERLRLNLRKHAIEIRRMQVRARARACLIQL